MVHVQPVKCVWSTLHKVLLQTVGNKQRETEPRALCLERGKKKKRKLEQPKGHKKHFH